MSHETPTIEARPRERTGSLHSRRLRRHGRLPAVVYGHKQEPVAVSVDEKEILTHLRHGRHVLKLAIDGGQGQTVLVKDLQFGYLGDEVIHLDFARVDLEEEVHVNVHLNYVGQPHAAERAGAILSHDLTELEVVCRVNEIPEEIRVDLALMGEDTRLTVGQVELPAKVRAAADPETVLAHVTYVKKHEEPTVGEEAEVEAGAEPEVITEAKAGEEPAAKESE